MDEVIIPSLEDQSSMMAGVPDAATEHAGREIGTHTFR
jgi:hypothetical protein